MTRKQYSKCGNIISEAKAQTWEMIVETGITNEDAIAEKMYRQLSERLADVMEADSAKRTSTTFRKELSCIDSYRSERNSRCGAERCIEMQKFIENIGWTIALGYEEQKNGRAQEQETVFSVPEINGV